MGSIDYHFFALTAKDFDVSIETVKDIYNKSFGDLLTFYETLENYIDYRKQFGK